MKNLNSKVLALSIVLTASLANACQSAPSRAAASSTAGASRLTVQTHTAGEAGFFVNSHLISGAKEAILVDAQFTRSEARQVAAMVKASGKELKAIFVTHGHPDHYFGLEILASEFPRARLLATADVVQEIQATAAGKLKYWKPLYKDDLAETLVSPQVFSESELTVDGEKLELVQLKNGESESATALYLPSQNLLVAGDLAYNQVHLWLAEGRPEGWLEQLQFIRTLGPIQTVLPGHGPVGGPEILTQDQEYIQAFQKISTATSNKKSALAEIVKRYPTYKLPIIAELSVGAMKK